MSASSDENSAIGKLAPSAQSINVDKLALIEIVDKLIHSITRLHIPDYPEAQTTLDELTTLINKVVKEELEALLLHRPKFPEAKTYDGEPIDWIPTAVIEDKLKDLNNAGNS